MANTEQTLRLSIPGASSERTYQALDELHKRLYGINGKLLVKAFGRMATRVDLVTFDPSPDAPPVEQLSDTDLVNTLFDGTDNGIYIALGKDPQLNAAIDNDDKLNEAMARLRSLKSSSKEEVGVARRTFSAHELRVFGSYVRSYVIGPNLQVVAQEDDPPLADGPSNSLSIADVARIA